MPGGHRWDPFQSPRRVVHPVRRDPTGRNGPTPGAVRGPGWRRTSAGLYVPAGTDRSIPEQRVAEEAATLPPDGWVTGWAALRMHGAAFFDGRAPDGRTELPVLLGVPLGCHLRPRPGVGHVRSQVPTTVVIRGVRCAGVRRALFDAMRLEGGLRGAVVSLDMAAAARLTSVARMRSYLESRPSWRGVPGVPVVRRALLLADDDSASPPESRLRLVWLLDARLPRPLVNQPVFTLGGELLGYPDLLDVEAGLVIEYDGDDHRSAPRHSHDVDREAGFREHGLEVTRVTGHDLRRTAPLVHRLHTARSRAPFQASSRRTWTLVPPPWFRPRIPVDVLLDLRGVDGRAGDVSSGAELL